METSLSASSFVNRSFVIPNLSILTTLSTHATVALAFSPRLIYKPRMKTRTLSRRGFVRLLGLTGLTAVTGRIFAQSPKPLAPGRVIDLRDMLTTGLKCRRPVEFAYIDGIVALVDAGVLPESLVRSTFAYARKRRPYPLVYFQQALRRRAKKLGIAV